MDCASSCPVGVVPKGEPVYATIGGLNQTTVIIGTVFVALGVFGVIIGTYLSKSSFYIGRPVLHFNDKFYIMFSNSARPSEMLWWIYRNKHIIYQNFSAMGN